MTAEASTSQKKLDPAVFQRLYPRAYLQRFLNEGIRPDARTPAAWRNVNVNVGSVTTADGSSLVRMGNTIVVCGVKVEIAEPQLDRPTDGFIVPNIDLPAMSSPRFKPGPPSEEAQVLSSRLNEVLVSSGIIPTSSLCIHPGKVVWVLYVDAVCLNYDGNTFDASLLAMVSALKNTRLPRAKFNEDTGRTTCSRKTNDPLQLGKLPFSATFGIFDSSYLLADPTSFEEPLIDSLITVILDEDGALQSVIQAGAGTVGERSGEEVVANCVAEARTRCSQLQNNISK